MIDIKKNIIDRALLKNKKIFLPEESDNRIKEAYRKFYS